MRRYNKKKGSYFQKIVIKNIYVFGLILLILVISFFVIKSRMLQSDMYYNHLLFPKSAPNCPQELLRCADGSTVARTEANCSFPICPGGPEYCSETTGLVCPDGQQDTIRKAGTDLCIFPACSSVVQMPIPTSAPNCPQEVLRCLDQSYVSRIGPKCEFSKCPVGPAKCSENMVLRCAGGKGSPRKADTDLCIFPICSTLDNQKQ